MRLLLFMVCVCREDVLHGLGYVDIFKACKDTENAAALQLLPQVSVDMMPISQSMLLCRRRKRCCKADTQQGGLAASPLQHAMEETDSSIGLWSE
jgi:hypothetical protein